ncbi:MAG: hypothetical protein ACE5K0_11365, partial [Candidatus Methanofastidiosia archaeon]
MRRSPAIMKRIEDLKDERRVSIVGTVVRVDELEFLLDDGTGQITVLVNSKLDFGEGSLIRVIGRVFGDSIEAEIIQDMRDLNLKLYLKTYELKKRVES